MRQPDHRCHGIVAIQLPAITHGDIGVEATAIIAAALAAHAVVGIAVTVIGVTAEPRTGRCNNRLSESFIPP